MNTSGRRMGMNFGGWSSGVGHTITANGDVTNTRAIGNFNVQSLIVGGGGGGNNTFTGGGGAAGGFREITTSIDSSKAWAITVGSGGSTSSKGNDSSAFGYISTGGGAGDGDNSIDSTNDGGSGGGGSGGPEDGGGTNHNGGSGNTPSTSPSQGNNGGYGRGHGSGRGAGGGGGSGGAGGNGSSGASSTGGNGGTGTQNAWQTGSNQYYAAGGGGGASGDTSGTGGTGGSSIGGNGASKSVNATSPTADTGSGGGGRGDGSGSPTAGSDGIVVIRYQSASSLATGGTITTYGSGASQYYVHTFTADGTFTPSASAIDKPGISSIKFDGTGDYLSSPDSSDWNIFSSGNWTTETWVKLDNHSQAEHLFGQYASGTSKWEITHNGAGSGNGLSFGLKVGSGAGSWVIDSGYASGGSGEITDTNWHHVALVKNSTTYTLYLDGTALDNTVTDTDTDDISGPLSIGQNGASGSYLTGYMDEIRISDSARYTTTFTPSTTAFVADSNTKLLIHSDFNGGLGADSSGNKNDFSVTNLVATDQVIDTPTNNYCTMNSLYANGQATQSTYKEGNLEVVSPAGSDLNGMTEGTIGIPSSGKWYWEHYTDNANYQLCGIAAADFLTGTASQAYMGYGKSRGYMSSNGNKVGSAVYTAYGNTWTTGDIIGVAVDMDNGSIYFAKNNTWQDSGDPTSGASKTGAAYTDLLTSSDFDSGIMPGWSDQNGATTDTTIANFGQDSSFAGNKTAQGNGGDGEDFYYTPPSGYVALNTNNLSAPSIALPTAHFNTKLYTGTGSELAVTGVGFQPDFTWIKTRTLTYNHRVFDSVRTQPYYELYPNTTAAEVTDDPQALKSFDTDGFTLGTSSGVNPSSTMVSWNWKAGGAAVTKATGNIDGTNPTIASSVSASTTAGFSIVIFDGTGSSGTVEHGLSQAPDLIITKKRDDTSGNDQNWIVGSSALAAGKTLELNGASAVGTISAYDSTIASASVINYLSNNNTNQSGSNFVAYCFHSVEGYSKVGSFSGNGSTDGSFIYTGMKPSYLLIKRTDTTGRWSIWDNKREDYDGNPNDTTLRADSIADPEQDSTDNSLDFLSNGFKLRNASNFDNNSSGTYIYLAFAESPFKTSNAR